MAEMSHKNVSVDYTYLKGLKERITLTTFNSIKDSTTFSIPVHVDDIRDVLEDLLTHLMGDKVKEEGDG